VFKINWCIDKVCVNELKPVWSVCSSRDSINARTWMCSPPMNTSRKKYFFHFFCLTKTLLIVCSRGFSLFLFVLNFFLNSPFRQSAVPVLNSSYFALSSMCFFRNECASVCLQVLPKCGHFTTIT
jgi:hypothetical protein